MRTKYSMTLFVTIVIALSLIVACGPATTPTSTSATTVPTVLTATEIERAREALETFFSLLHDQLYDEAVNYYGGAYDVLRDWNPTVAQDDFATLWRNGCTINGLQCLKVETVVQQEEVSPTEFRFIVEFMNDDGTLFTRGPSETQFEYTVKKVNNRFLVQDLPIYVP